MWPWPCRRISLPAQGTGTEAWVVLLRRTVLRPRAFSWYLESGLSPLTALEHSAVAQGPEPTAAPLPRCVGVLPAGPSQGPLSPPLPPTRALRCFSEVILPLMMLNRLLIFLFHFLPNGFLKVFSSCFIALTDVNSLS